MHVNEIHFMMKTSLCSCINKNVNTKWWACLPNFAQRVMLKTENNTTALPEWSDHFKLASRAVITPVEHFSFLSFEISVKIARLFSLH